MHGLNNVSAELSPKWHRTRTHQLYLFCTYLVCKKRGPNHQKKISSYFSTAELRTIFQHDIAPEIKLPSLIKLQLGGMNVWNIIFLESSSSGHETLPLCDLIMHHAWPGTCKLLLTSYFLTKIQGYSPGSKSCNGWFETEDDDYVSNTVDNWSNVMEGTSSIFTLEKNILEAV